MWRKKHLDWDDMMNEGEERRYAPNKLDFLLTAEYRAGNKTVASDQDSRRNNEITKWGIKF